MSSTLLFLPEMLTSMPLPSNIASIFSPHSARPRTHRLSFSLIYPYTLPSSHVHFCKHWHVGRLYLNTGTRETIPLFLPRHTAVVLSGLVTRCHWLHKHSSITHIHYINMVPGHDLIMQLRNHVYVPRWSKWFYIPSRFVYL